MPTLPVCRRIAAPAATQAPMRPQEVSAYIGGSTPAAKVIHIEHPGANKVGVLTLPMHKRVVTFADVENLPTHEQVLALSPSSLATVGQESTAVPGASPREGFVSLLVAPTPTASEVSKPGHYAIDMPSSAGTSDLDPSSACSRVSWARSFVAIPVGTTSTPLCSPTCYPDASPLKTSAATTSELTPCGHASPCSEYFWRCLVDQSPAPGRGTGVVAHNPNKAVTPSVTPQSMRSFFF
eukprot:TRINITY_DN23603_c0_g1_i1.p1 TRINITY_DN23603_c0_g1~~TRINITY_DN23603_c0_g1_i1.p1  ORF type:complete len:238 (-),score=22.55 TRINITY_DN23603_c0_g1_i1:162-875(-)